MPSAAGRNTTDYLIEEGQTLLLAAAGKSNLDVRALATAVAEHVQRLASGRVCNPTCSVCEREATGRGAFFVQGSADAEGVVVIRPERSDGRPERRAPADGMDDLLAFWRSRRNGREIPARADFVAEEFGPWMGNLVICGVEGRPERFRLRLIGNAVRQLDDRDYTGRYLDECLPAPLRDHVVGQWALSVAERKPVAVRYRSRSAAHGPIEIRKLFLPMAAGSNGVGQVFAWIRANGAWRAGVDRPSLHDVERDGSSEITVLSA